MSVQGVTTQFVRQIAVTEPYVANRSFHHQSGFGGYEVVSENKLNLVETARVMNHTAPGETLGNRRAEADREVDAIIKHY